MIPHPCLFILIIAIDGYQVEAIQAEVTKQQQETEADLWKAEPALQAANAALNTLNRVCICVCSVCMSSHTYPNGLF